MIDASGRRSRLPRWLAELGHAEVEQEEEPCGIFYCSRFYSLRPGAVAPEGQGVVGADLGYMKFGIFPGDSGIFSITLAASLDDDPLRAILHEGPFEAAARALPATREWIEPARSTPVTEVRAMAKLVNRRRRFVRDGEPLALGVFAIGDAAICSNPLYGRGCALAFVHSWEFADAVRDHAGDLRGLALAFDAATRREIEPWYRAARDQDRESREIAARRPGARRGAGRRGLDAARAGGGSEGEFLRSVFRDGLIPALRSDAAVVRAFMRTFNLLAPPDAFMKDADVIGRVLAAWRERDQRAPLEVAGPGRTEMVELLAPRSLIAGRISGWQFRSAISRLCRRRSHPPRDAASQDPKIALRCASMRRRRSAHSIRLSGDRSMIFISAVAALVALGYAMVLYMGVRSAPATDAQRRRDLRRDRRGRERVPESPVPDGGHGRAARSPSCC